MVLNRTPSPGVDTDERLAEPLLWHTLECFERYWPGRSATIASYIPRKRASGATTPSIPPVLVSVALPDWASDIGVEGHIRVPAHCIKHGSESEWVRTGWIETLAWYAHGFAERMHEATYGSVQSYADRLAGWDESLWRHAWGNRIALFLRRWTARSIGGSEQQVFGPLPKAEIILTHDVDAIKKTMVLRIKQTVFRLLSLVKGHGTQRQTPVHKQIRDALTYLCSPGDYFQIESVIEMEKCAGKKSIFFFFAGLPLTRSLPARLLDPQYDVISAELKRAIQQLIAEGWRVGLHPSYDSWSDARNLSDEKRHLESVCPKTISECRQHWLRFSWRDTWRAQKNAGFMHDYTLGFNDRMGFRNSCAITMRPWDFENGMPLEIDTTPLVLMDSQLYLSQKDEDRRTASIDALIDEINSVRGQASVLWHPHGFSPDIGWQDDYRILLDRMHANISKH